MTAITQRPDGLHELRYVENGRARRKLLRTTSRADAELMAISRPVSRRNICVIDALDAWTKDHLIPRHQQNALSVAARNAMVTHFATRPIDALTDDDFRQYSVRREAGKLGLHTVKPQTVRKELNFLQAALNHCIARGMCGRTKPFRLPKPRGGQPRDKWLTEDQEKALITAAKAEPLDVQIFLQLGLSYGARRSAILELTWARVDFDRDEIDFRPDNQIATRKRRAVVPMTAAVRDLLLQKVRVGEKVLDRTTATKFTAFTGRIGMPWVTPHVLKHTAVTQMMRQGFDVSIVAALTATSVQTLMATYRHHSASELRAAAERRI
jgi:integrase